MVAQTHCMKKKQRKLNHVVTSYGDCTSDKFNCNYYSVYGGGKWLMLHRLEFWEVCSVFRCRVFLKQEKSIIYVSSCRPILCCLCRVCESRNSPCSVRRGLPVICCLEANFCVLFRKAHQNSRGSK